MIWPIADATVVETIALVIWLASGAVHPGAMVLALLQPMLVRRLANKRQDQPPVSVLLPVKAADHDVLDCFGRVASLDYPAFEIIVSSDASDAPAFQMIRNATGRFDKEPIRCLVSNDRIGRNPKINNLVPALAASRFDTLLIKDANIAFEPRDLANLVRHLGVGVGLVCAIPVAVGPGSLAADVEQAMMNGRDAPYVLAASVLGANLGYGKVLLFRKPDFARIGGLATLADCFGDDHELSRAMARIGLTTAYTDGFIRQPLGCRTWRAVIDRQSRWLVIRRDQAFFAFLMEPVVAWPMAALSAAVAAPALGWSGPALAIATVLLRLAAEIAMLVSRGWPITWRSPFAALSRDLITLALWLPAWRARHVNWAGHSHDHRRTVVPSQPER